MILKRMSFYLFSFWSSSGVWCRGCCCYHYYFVNFSHHFIPKPLNLIPPPWRSSCRYQNFPRSPSIYRPRRCLCLFFNSCLSHVLLFWNCWPLFLKRFFLLSFPSANLYPSSASSHSKMFLLSGILDLMSLSPTWLFCPLQLSSISTLSDRVTTGCLCFLKFIFFILFYFIYFSI